MRKHCWMPAACLMLCLTIAGSARSQSATPSADELGAARELITTMRAADNFKAIMPSILRTLKPAIVQNRPEVERDYDAIVPLMLASMSARLNEIIDQIAALYARNFTTDELREITSFYRGAVGQKFVQKQPLIMQESMAIGQQFGQSFAREMQSRITDELRKRGHKI
jgi:uncharacterized protein